jgi:hypothetical protein
MFVSKSSQYSPDLGTEFDSITQNQSVIDHNHCELHQGGVWTGVDQTSTASIVKYVITTGAQVVHLYTTVACDNTLTWTLYESSTGVSGGTAVSLAIRNRAASSNTIYTTIKAGCTVTGNGTRLDVVLVAAGNGINGIKPIDEWVLNANTTYTIAVTAITGTPNYSIGFTAYEEPQQDY